MLELIELLRRIDLRKAELDAHRPLLPITVASLRDKLALDWTYHSNAIEGNTLTLRETKVALEDGITIGKKSLREHYSNQLVLKNIDDTTAGQYRTDNLLITGAGFIPPDHLHLPEKMAMGTRPVCYSTLN